MPIPCAHCQKKDSSGKVNNAIIVPEKMLSMDYQIPEKNELYGNGKSTATLPGAQHEAFNPLFEDNQYQAADSLHYASVSNAIYDVPSTLPLVKETRLDMSASSTTDGYLDVAPEDVAATEHFTLLIKNVRAHGQSPLRNFLENLRTDSNYKKLISYQALELVAGENIYHLGHDESATDGYPLPGTVGNSPASSINSAVVAESLYDAATLAQGDEVLYDEATNLYKRKNSVGKSFSGPTTIVYDVAQSIYVALPTSAVPEAIYTLGNANEVVAVEAIYDHATEMYVPNDKASAKKMAAAVQSGYYMATLRDETYGTAVPVVKVAPSGARVAPAIPPMVPPRQPPTVACWQPGELYEQPVSTATLPAITYQLPTISSGSLVTFPCGCCYHGECLSLTLPFVIVNNQLVCQRRGQVCARYTGVALIFMGATDSPPNLETMIPTRLERPSMPSWQNQQPQSWAQRYLCCGAREKKQVACRILAYALGLGGIAALIAMGGTGQLVKSNAAGGPIADASQICSDSEITAENLLRDALGMSSVTAATCIRDGAELIGRVLNQLATTSAHNATVQSVYTSVQGSLNALIGMGYSVAFIQQVTQIILAAFFNNRPTTTTTITTTLPTTPTTTTTIVPHTTIVTTQMTTTTLTTPTTTTSTTSTTTTVGTTVLDTTVATTTSQFLTTEAANFSSSTVPTTTVEPSSSLALTSRATAAATTAELTTLATTDPATFSTLLQTTSGTTTTTPTTVTTTVTTTQATTTFASTLAPTTVTTTRPPITDTRRGGGGRKRRESMTPTELVLNTTLTAQNAMTHAINLINQNMMVPQVSWADWVFSPSHIVQSALNWLSSWMTPPSQWFGQQHANMIIPPLMTTNLTQIIQHEILKMTNNGQREPTLNDLGQIGAISRIAMLKFSQAYPKMANSPIDIVNVQDPLLKKLEKQFRGKNPRLHQVLLELIRASLKQVFNLDNMSNKQQRNLAPPYQAPNITSILQPNPANVTGQQKGPRHHRGNR